MSSASPAPENASSNFPSSGSDAEATISQHQAAIHHRTNDFCTPVSSSSTVTSPATGSHSHGESCDCEASSDDEESWNSKTLIPSLPTDVALNVLARIPRSHHPNLSLVSKPIKSLLSSSAIYTARSLHNCKQHFLYISLRSPGNTFLHFYTLNRNPNTLKKLRSCCLIPVAQVPASGLIGSTVAAIGHRIVVIGGSANDVPSPHVWSLDCRFHTWERLPNMRVPRELAAAGVVGDKLYVIGGCLGDTWTRSRNWAEVYDPKSGEWSSVPSPIEMQHKWMHASAVIDEKVYAMADRGGVFYDAGTGDWGAAEKRLELGWRGRDCVIGGVLFCYDYLGKIRGYLPKQKVWKELEGVKKSLPKFLCGATMANVGGNLVVVWEKRGGNGKEMEIWCAEIKVEERRGELQGEIQWCHVVLSPPNYSSVVNCLAVEL